PDAFAGDGKVLADLFQRVLAAVRPQAEAHLDDFLFARRERLQDLFGDLAEVDVDDRFRRVLDRLVLDEIAEVRILFFTNRRFERDGLLRDLQDLADFRGRDVHLFGNLFAGWLASEFLHQGA